MAILNADIIDRAQKWLSEPFDTNTQSEVQKLIINDNKALAEAFYQNLEFGTGGMRGIMGVGTNRINKYTLGKNTQGIANYMAQQFPSKKLRVAIAYDCRHNSQNLAKVVADVFSANGINVYLFSDMRPTPVLSFAVKYLQCQCGIVLTASHNPPEYNGYKVYWEDGGQLVPPHDAAIIQMIESLDYNQILFEPQADKIHYINQEVDDAFIASSLKHARFDLASEVRKNLKIVFTSLHGTSIKTVPQTLEKAGYSQVHIVPEQAVPNGDFPTVKSPNPEEPEALAMALDLADKTHADIVIGTDPDSDRLGIAVRDLNGKMHLLNGNQTMVLMTHALLEDWKQKGKITGSEFIGSTIVSTPMMLELATAYGVECKVGLTGFKWIAKMIKDFPELTFIGGGEESFGFMVGDAVRDKDAVAATLLICEIAARAKQQGKTVFENLISLYTQFGFYKERLISITKKGIEGAREIKQMMVDLRENPLKEINGQTVVCIEDYQNSTAKNLISNEAEVLDIPQSNVLIYYLADGSKICARPSGTEPKIKFYFSVNTSLEDVAQYGETEALLEARIDRIIADLKLNA
ncbi:MAG: phospho-sugar mutase [Bacteroidetes bacterium]|nr:phospho-sugar mutase [Bacteroidota bacterium]